MPDLTVGLCSNTSAGWLRARKTGPTSWVYASPPFAEPVLAWQRAIWSKDAFSLVAERPEYDGLITIILAELDADKRAKQIHDMAQKLYEQYHGVILGMKSTTWALSKKVGNWSTLVSVPLENNYKYVAPAG